MAFDVRDRNGFVTIRVHKYLGSEHATRKLLRLLAEQGKVEQLEDEGKHLVYRLKDSGIPAGMTGFQ